MPARPFDSFAVGEQVTSYGRTVTEADIVLFTGVAGIKLPVFLDDEWCRANTNYGGRIAPGLLTGALAVGMMEEVLGGNALAALALDAFRFHVPVRPGDTLHAQVEVLAKRDTSDGKRGILTLAVRVYNQREEHAMGFQGTFLMRKES